MFFFLRHIMEFWKHLLKKFRPKKRLIILITYYSQYSCKKNQEKKPRKTTPFLLPLNTIGLELQLLFRIHTTLHTTQYAVHIIYI